MDSTSDGGLLTLEDPVTKFSSYEEYLDTFVTQQDLSYIGDPELCRDLIEHTHKGKDALSREQFEERKRLARNGTRTTGRDIKALCHVGKDLSFSVLMQELARREMDIRNGRMETIVFIRDENVRGHEISGYIDIGHRMRTEDFTPYFTGKKKLYPMPTDLSYYNWRTQTLRSTPSPSFEVIAEDVNGLAFKHKRDRKLIFVNPKAESVGDNSTRTPLITDEYSTVVLYDHLTRRKNV